MSWIVETLVEWVAVDLVEWLIRKCPLWLKAIALVALLLVLAGGLWLLLG